MASESRPVCIGFSREVSTRIRSALPAKRNFEARLLWRRPLGCRARSWILTIVFADERPGNVDALGGIKYRRLAGIDDQGDAASFGVGVQSPADIILKR